jgi:GTP-binding protein
MNRLLIALIGRPNVGKSTLFNRLVGKRTALVADMPGVTRDRRYGEGSIGDLTFSIIDTPGLGGPKDPFGIRARQQTEAAIAEANILLIVLDAKSGLMPEDKALILLAQKANKPIIPVVNKSESKVSDYILNDIYALGLNEPVFVSAEHNLGFSALWEALAPYLPPEKTEDTWEENDDKPAEDLEIRPTSPLQLAIVGRPNVGKSSLINKILKTERLMTGPEAGVTRDAIQVPFTWQSHDFLLVDTAGMRKGSKGRGGLDGLSMMETQRAIQYSNVVALVLDGTSPLDKQELSIAEMVMKEGRALIIVINKADLMEHPLTTVAEVKETLKREFSQAKDIPVLLMSVMQNPDFKTFFETILELYGRWNKRVGTGELNRWLEDVLGHHPPPLANGRAIRIRYITQIKTRPPTFVIFASKPTDLPESYLRYLVNQLHKSFDFSGIPVRISTRKGKNPYAEK